MWIRLLLLYQLLYVTIVYSHIPSYMSTPPNKIDQYCILADTCVHDTIPVCGRMGEETRTFMDICDMLEYACDSNKVYNHIEDMEGCPAIANKP